MTKTLPHDLFEAESQIQESIVSTSINSSKKLFTINLLFQNLRINPILKRICLKLSERDIGFYIIWPDEGASALCKRDLEEFSDYIFSFNRFIKEKSNLNEYKVLLAINPQPFDFDQFKEICESYSGKIFMINGKLEDIAIGIGNVGRERRKQFISSWEYIYWLQPINKGAIMKLYQSNWILFKLDEDGYRYCESFEIKPDEESILEAFNK